MALPPLSLDIWMVRSSVAFIIVSLISSLFVESVEQCSVGQGGGMCPDLNTCCLMEGGSGCISGGMGSFNATCCADGLTGCPKGYLCEPHGRCQSTHERQDPLLHNLPRYTLCHLQEATLTTVHGLSIVGDAKLPYYSSHGSIEQSFQSDIQMALIVIHGGGRNADDYFCPAMAALQSQTTYSPDSVLLIVPRFLTAADETVELQEGGIPLKWGGKGHGRWRFGASAIHPVQNVTSFDAVDVLVKLLGNHQLFPNLHHIVITGHSVGGQFVQRWSLLTSSWIPKRMSAVVANPSSWTFLTPKRLVNGEWQIPNKTTCPRYNQWTWGLDHGNKMQSPYKDETLQVLGVKKLIQRYAKRHVTHLIGSADRCNVTGKHEWCQSHDLGVECMDELQGASRWDRHNQYVESLELVGITSHQSLVVEGVGHDHALIFTSTVGQSVLFPAASSVRPSLLGRLANQVVSLFMRGQVPLHLSFWNLCIGENVI